ncbi:GNAT family N-acetyltransferase [Dactylosporangium salmoneum]
MAELVGVLGDAEMFADQLRRQAEGLGQLLVAWVGGLAVGVVYLRWEPADEPEIRRHLHAVPLLRHLEVHPEWRKRGVGSRLLREAEARLAGRGFRRVALGVAPDNFPAISLYRKQGYEKWPQPDVKTAIDEFSVMVKDLRR